MSKSIKKIGEEINRLAVEYAGTKDRNRKLYIKDCMLRELVVLSDENHGKNKVFKKEYIYQVLYDSMIDCIFEKNILDEYTEEKGNFWTYLFTCADRISIDRWRKDHLKDGKDKNGRQKWKDRFLPMESIDKPDTVLPSTDNEYEKKQLYVSYMINFLALFSHDGICFSGKKDTDSNREFIRLFYTERFIDICKNISSGDTVIHDVLKNNETTAVHSIDIDFSDYVHVKPCRKIEEFEILPYKLRKYFDIAQSPEKELDNPFNAKVYITFFDRIRNRSVSAALFSRKQTEFKDILKKHKEKQW